MMCHHCEATVKKALEALPEVSEAIPDYQNGTVTVKLSGNVNDKILKKAVTGQGYKVSHISKN